LKTIVVGDVHGCYTQLMDLMNLIGVNADDRIILLGDFVDRGPDSPACLEFAKRHEAIMGNHEYKHVRFRNGILKQLSPSQIQARQQYVDRGLDYDAAVDFMENLPFYMDLPEAVLVHAGLRYGIPMPKQDPRVLVGGMSQKQFCGIDPATGYPFWCATYPKDAKPVLFGHLTIRGKIPRQENLFPLDTGCCHGNMLSAITLPDFNIYQVPGL
jgi:serine/threonine protein phosphatase 1